MIPDLLTPRLAGPADADSLFNLCCSLWEENGLFKMSEVKVRRFIECATDPNSRRQNDPISIIGVIGEPGKIEASLALAVVQNWYSDDWHVEELWNFVRPDKRKSCHAKSLIEYSKKTAQELGLPLMIGILSADRTEGKIRMYSRQLGAPSGAYFVWPSWIDLRDQKRQMASFRSYFIQKNKAA